MVSDNPEVLQLQLYQGDGLQAQIRLLRVIFWISHPTLVSNRENAAAATTTFVAIVGTTTTTSSANASTNTTATKNFNNLLVWQ